MARRSSPCNRQKILGAKALKTPWIRIFVLVFAKITSGSILRTKTGSATVIVELNAAVPRMIILMACKNRQLKSLHSIDSNRHEIDDLN